MKTLNQPSATDSRSNQQRYDARKGVNTSLLLKADAFGTIFGEPEGADAMARAGYIVSCGVGYALTGLGRETLANLRKGGAS